jgi:hypothetical protein
MSLEDDLTLLSERTSSDHFRSLTDPASPTFHPRYLVIVPALATTLRTGKAPAPALPSLARQAVNFAGAVVSHVTSGLPELDEASYQARLAVCRGGCEFFTVDDDQPRCAHGCCGCFLEVKARWADQTCPVGKWPGLALAGTPP